MENNFFETLELNSDIAVKLKNSEHIIQEIYEECGRKYNYPCGSYLFDGYNGFKYYPPNYSKIDALYNLAKKANTVLEVGSYMGHSLLIMLLANPNLNIYVIDISDEYIRPSLSVLRKYFPNANLNIYVGRSEDIVPTLSQKVDFIHLDGGHNEDDIKKDLSLISRISKTNKITVMIDDVFNNTDVLDGYNYNMLFTDNVAMAVEIVFPKNEKYDVDLLVCVCERDVNTLKYAIDSILRHSFCSFNNIIIYVDSYDIPSWSDNIISVYPNVILKTGSDFFDSEEQFRNIGGWYRQQVVKMTYCYITKSDYYLTWDSDIIANQRLEFIINNKPVLYLMEGLFHSDQPIGHKQAIKQLIKKKYNVLWDTPAISKFVNSYMVVRTKHIFELLENISRHRLIEYVENMTSNKRYNGISEYEMIAYWILNNYPEEYVVERITNVMSEYQPPFDSEAVYPHDNIVACHRWLFD